MVWLQVFFPIKKGGFAEQKGAIYPLIIVSKESFSITPPNTHTHTHTHTHTTLTLLPSFQLFRHPQLWIRWCS